MMVAEAWHEKLFTDPAQIHLPPEQATLTSEKPEWVTPVFIAPPVSTVSP